MIPSTSALAIALVNLLFLVLNRLICTGSVGISGIMAWEYFVDIFEDGRVVVIQRGNEVKDF